MTGEYRHSFDSKGRVFIPAKMREEVGEVLYFTVSADGCLNAFSEKSWKELTDRVNAMPYIKQRRMRPVFAYASKCELDAQGRALVPQNLRDFAGITKSVTIVGCNNHFEFWESGAWDRVFASELTAENLANVMEELNI